MSYATRNKRPPRTLTDAETAKLMKVSGAHVDGFRDHVIFSLALGCALRESEIVALNVEDVTNDGKRPFRMIYLRIFKRAARGDNFDPDAQRVPVPDGTYYKLQKYLTLVQHEKGPLFLSRNQRRLSTRTVRLMFKTWQKRAGFDRPYSFHHLRHTAVTNMYRVKRDVRAAQSFARHANLDTTRIYTHLSDEEMVQAAKDLPS